MTRANTPNSNDDDDEDFGKEDEDEGECENGDEDEDEEDPELDGYTDDEERQGTSILVAGSPTNTIDKALHGLDKEKLIDLVHVLVNSGSSCHRTMLEWMSKNISKPANEKQAGVDDHLLSKYLDDLDDSLANLEADCRGDDEGFDVVEVLDKIEALLDKGTVSRNLRMILIEDLLEKGDLFDYGFDKEANSACFKACKDAKDWLHFVELLNEARGVGSLRLAARIYKEYLNDDKEYLKARLASLENESDYLDLAMYHAGKGDLSTSIEVAESGLLSARGCGLRLVNYLFDTYEAAERSEDLRRIVDIASRNRVADVALLDRIFTFYKNRGEYDRAKDVLLKSINLLIFKDDPYDRYQMLKTFLTTNDWASLEPVILQTIKKKSNRAFLQICLDKGLLKEILASVMDAIPKVTGKTAHYQTCNPVEDEFAAQLVKFFPKKIADYYWRMAIAAIDSGNARGYRDARHYLLLAKEAFTNVLKMQDNWNAKFSALKEVNKRRTSFLKEIQSI